MSSDLRQACDRCHDKKLRCPKPSAPSGSSASVASCSRCAKAGVPCLFSPPSRPLRRHDAAAAVTVTPASAAALPLAPVSWDLLDFDRQQQQDHVVYDDAAAAAAIDPTAFIASGPCQDASVGLEEPGMAQLAEILLGLDQVLRDLPTGDQHRGGLGNLSKAELLQRLTTLGVVHNIEGNLEAMLRHIQRLVSFYPGIVHLAISDNSEDDLLATKSTVDHALLHLLFACHVRVLDVVDRLMDLCQLCGELAAPLMSEGYVTNVDVPEIRIGSFVAPKDAAGPMLLSVMSELQAMLISRAKALARRLSLVQSRGVDNLQTLIVQSETLKDRSYSAFNELSKLRDSTTRIGLLR